MAVSASSHRICGSGFPLCCTATSKIRAIASSSCPRICGEWKAWLSQLISGDREGVGHYQLTMHDGRRCTAASAFLHPARHRSADEDRVSLLGGMRICRRIMEHPRMDPCRSHELSPGPDCGTDEELLAFCRDTAKTAYHPVGTCKMGHDPMAVVDDRLRVHGVERLRVIDASVMPTLTSGTTNAPTIMIAEKGADMAKEDAA